jgi:hypothetical protein
MAIRYLGKKAIGVAIPVLAQLLATFDLPGLAGEIAALATITVSFVPPSIVGILQLIADINAKIQAGIQPVTVQLNVDLIARLGLLKVKLALLLEITKLLLAAGVHAYVYEGPAAGMGPDLTDEFSPGPSQGGITAGGQIYSVVLVVEASNQVTVTAVKTVFGDLP